jgi:hypothetical protein
VTPGRGFARWPARIALALAALCGQARAADEAGAAAALEVAVHASGTASDVAAMPIEFLAPLADAEAAQEGQCFLRSSDGVARLCQYERLPKGEVDLGYSWARFRALVPNRDASYVFGRTAELVPGSVAAVSSLVAADAVVLDTGALKLTVDPGKCEVVKEASFLGRPAVARSYEGLINRQQGLRVTVTDRIRRVDFELEPLGRSGKWQPVTTGPVATTIAYKGVLMCPTTLPATAFEARLTLTAGGMMVFEADLREAALDREVYAFKDVEITLPLVLERAATLSFGGRTGDVRGRSFWSGEATLAAGEGGSYRFVDGDGSVMSGAGALSWADYCDGDRGLAVFWKPGARASLSVDYSEDLVTLRLPLDDAEPRLAVHLMFHEGQGDAAWLSAVAALLESPPAAAASDGYITATTRAR